MLESLVLENFKAFGERTEIPFAPITLIFGENSAGKSSILQCLNLLKQTRESREHGALLLPRAESGIVDLGSFQELLFDHELSRPLSIGLRFSLRDAEAGRQPVRRLLPENATSIGIEFVFHRPNEQREVSLKQLKCYLSDPTSPVAVFEPTATTPDLRRFVSGDPYVYRRARGRDRRDELRVAKCVHVTDSPEFWGPRYSESRRAKREILTSLQLYKKIVPRMAGRPTVGDSDRGLEEQIARIEQAEAFYSSDFTLTQYIKRVREAELNTVVALDGFMPTLIRGDRDDLLPEDEAVRYRGSGGYRFRLEVASLVSSLNHLLDEGLERLFPMGPFRRPPERWYIFTGTSPQDVGYKGDLLPDLLFRRPDIVTESNRWLEKLQIGYELEVRSVGENSKDLFEVRLRDTRRKRSVDVGLSDVGFGISQLLPFLVQSLTGEQRIITIEQPEVHVHPRLQADIADVLAEAIRRPRWHRFIIETHSEDLVLRTQQLVKEKKLVPSDLSIIFVSRSATGARAQRIRVDESGDFLDEWPGGFFTHRLRYMI